MEETIPLQVLTVLMGLGVMSATTYLGLKFWLIGKPLSRAFSYNLFGEFIASTGTTIFSVMQLLKIINSMSPHVATAIRIGMFMAMMASSLHMAFLIRNIEKHE